MLPLLLRLTFETPLACALLYAVLALAVALLARSGWRTASARGGGALWRFPRRGSKARRAMRDIRGAFLLRDE